VHDQLDSTSPIVQPFLVFIESQSSSSGAPRSLIGTRSMPRSSPAILAVETVQASDGQSVMCRPSGSNVPLGINEG
jgi:hypothetical protein